MLTDDQKNIFLFCPHLVGVLCFDGVLPVGLRGVGIWQWAARQPIAQIDRLLVVWGRWGRGGAEVQGGTDTVLHHLHVRKPTIWVVPSDGQNLRGGQGRQPVSTAAHRGIIVWRKQEETGGSGFIYRFVNKILM